MQQYWLTYEVKIFLHMNLPYGLIKHVLKEIAIFAILKAEDINDTIHVTVDHRVGICPFNVYKCDVN